MKTNLRLLSHEAEEKRDTANYVADPIANYVRLVSGSQICFHCIAVKTTTDEVNPRNCMLQTQRHFTVPLKDEI